MSSLKPKKFACSFCNSSFTRVDNLNYHIRTKHEGLIHCVSKKHNVSFDFAYKSIRKNPHLYLIFNKTLDTNLIDNYFSKANSNNNESNLSRVDPLENNNDFVNQFVPTISHLNPKVSSINESELTYKILTYHNDLNSQGVSKSSDIVNNVIKSNTTSHVPISKINPIPSLINNLSEKSFKEVSSDKQATKEDNSGVKSVKKAKLQNESIQSILLKSCNACQLMELYEASRCSFLKNLVKSSCRCNDKKSCCCKRKLDELFSEANEENSNWPTQNVDEDVFVRKSFKGDTLNDRWFCLVCTRFSPLTNTGGNSGDWTSTGKCINDVRRRNEAMRRHLVSQQHMKSLSHSQYQNKVSDQRVLPSKETQDKCTENCLLTSQYATEENVSTRAYSKLCMLMHRVNENMGADRINPLGNRHHSGPALKIMTLANFKAMIDNMKAFHSSNNKVTKQLRSYCICADKGTAPSDATRQVLIATFLNEEGLPVENVFSAACIYNQDADGALEHFRTYTKRFINLKCIVAVCTDSASIYLGKHVGMYPQLLTDSFFSKKLLFLPDFCHKCELLFKNKRPSWLQQMFTTSKELVSNIKSDKYYIEELRKLDNAQVGIKYFGLRTQSETRFTQYSYAHINSILKSLKAIVVAFEAIVADPPDDEAKAVAIKVLRIATNLEFIATLFTVLDIHKQITTLEKIAQSIEFGPFEYNSLVTKLRNVLEKSAKFSKNASHLLNTGNFRYKFIHRRKSMTIEIDLNETRRRLDFVAINIRDLKQKENIKSQFFKWIDSLQDRLPSYFEEIRAIMHCVNLFDFSSVDEASKIISFRLLFKILNVNFSPCSSYCIGFEKCHCLEKEIKSFFGYCKRKNIINDIDNIIPKHNHKYPLQTKVLSYFLSERNVGIYNHLEIINILRVMEVTLLLKASQSSTERAMSSIERIVKGKYENRYKYLNDDYTDLDDIVQAKLMLKKNVDLATCDPSSARVTFETKMKHKSCLISSKPTLKRSLTINRLLNKPPKKVRVREPVRSPSPDEFFSSECVFDDHLDIEDPEENRIRVSYCYCNGTQTYKDFIGCEKVDQCLSKISKLKNNIEGGDWFHQKCVGLVRKPPSNFTWYCSLCDEKSNLKIQLFNQGKIIKEIQGDGNCLYRALAQNKYGNDKKHIEMRNILCDQLKQLFESPKYCDMWAINHFSDNNINDPEHKLVRDLARYNRETLGITDSSFFTDEQKSKFIEYMSTPRNYGTEIDLALFSLLEQKTIWVLQDNQDEKNPLFKWFMTHSYIYDSDYEKNLNYVPYVTLLYSNPTGNTNNAHYDLILPAKKPKILDPPSSFIDIKKIV